MGESSGWTIDRIRQELGDPQARFVEGVPAMLLVAALLRSLGFEEVTVVFEQRPAT